MCMVWNANNPWISLTNPSAATSSATHLCVRQLFPSCQCGWLSHALNWYEPVGALFERLELCLPHYFCENSYLEAFSFLSLQYWRDGRGEMLAIPVGYVVSYSVFVNIWALGKNWMEYWRWSTDQDCCVLKDPCTAEETGAPPSWRTSRKTVT